MKACYTIFLFFIVGCSGEYQEVNITIEDFRFTPNQIRLYADQPIHLVIRNQGREPHRFKSLVLSGLTARVSGPSENLPIDIIQDGVMIHPGKTIELQFQLPVGNYIFRCPIRGHRGMTGRFVVETGR